jgi:hypothetical protein
MVIFHSFLYVYQRVLGVAQAKFAKDEETLVMRLKKSPQALARNDWFLEHLNMSSMSKRGFLEYWMCQ